MSKPTSINAADRTTAMKSERQSERQTGRRVRCRRHGHPVRWRVSLVWDNRVSTTMSHYPLMKTTNVVDWSKTQRRLTYIAYDTLFAFWECKQRMKPKLWGTWSMSVWCARMCNVWLIQTLHKNVFLLYWHQGQRLVVSNAHKRRLRYNTVRYNVPYHMLCLCCSIPLL